MVQSVTMEMSGVPSQWGHSHNRTDQYPLGCQGAGRHRVKGTCPAPGCKNHLEMGFLELTHSQNVCGLKYYLIEKEYFGNF